MPFGLDATAVSNTLLPSLAALIAALVALSAVFINNGFASRATKRTDERTELGWLQTQKYELHRRAQEAFQNQQLLSIYKKYRFISEPYARSIGDFIARPIQIPHEELKYYGKLPIAAFLTVDEFIKKETDLNMELLRLQNILLIVINDREDRVFPLDETNPLSSNVKQQFDNSELLCKTYMQACWSAALSLQPKIDKLRKRYNS